MRGVSTSAQRVAVSTLIKTWLAGIPHDSGRAIKEPRQFRSDSKPKPKWKFVNVSPFRQIDGPVLKHDASVIIHDEANRGFRHIISFS